MPANPIHPDQLHGDQRFRADLAAYLDSLPIGDLAELLGELPRSRQEPLGLGVLMIALNERLPDAFKLLPPAGHPGPVRGAAARCGRWWPAGVGVGWVAGRPPAAGRPARRADAGGCGWRAAGGRGAARPGHRR
jgi:hypothetical protein